MVNKIQSIFCVTNTTPYAVFLGFLLDDGPKPSVFGQNLAFLSKVQVKMCKNRRIVASRVKTGTSFSCSRNLIISMITVISDHFSYLLKKDFKKYQRSP